MTREEAIKAIKAWDFLNNDEKEVIETLIPKLSESEDEKIRKEVLAFIRREGQHIDKYKWHKWVAWLEKQDNKVIDCSQNHQDSNRPNGCIVFEDFNGGEGFYKLNLDYLNKKQLEEIEEMVRTWNKESEISDDNIKNCIGMCLTDVNEQRFKDYNTNLKDCLSWLEKQGNKPFDYENANIHQEDFAPKQEPKFKVGDFIVNDYCMGKVIELTDDAYLLDTGQGIPFSCEHNVHLWTIADAKDGDVLQLGVVTAIFKESIGNGNCKCYCSVCNGEFEIPSQDGADNSYGCHNATPATKEQRDTLMKAMADAGYTFDFEKKELKKIEQNPAWSDEDEKTYRVFIQSLVRIAANTRTDSTSVNYTFSREIDWLKSLKDKYTWKPSDEQMENLSRAFNGGTFQTSLLMELYQELKKLMEG